MKIWHVDFLALLNYLSLSAKATITLQFNHSRLVSQDIYTYYREEVKLQQMTGSLLISTAPLQVYFSDNTPVVNQFSISVRVFTNKPATVMCHLGSFRTLPCEL